MISSCNITIEHFDKRTNRVLTRKIRNKASIRVRKISNKFEIYIKTLNIIDFFITEKPIVFDRLKSEGKVIIKVPEQLSSISVSDTSERNISEFLGVLLSAKPVTVNDKSSPAKSRFDDVDKENIPQNYNIEDADSPTQSPGSKRHNKLLSTPCKSPSGKDLIDKTVSGMKKSLSPVKRRIPLGTGTPSKNINEMFLNVSPQNIRKIARLKSTSPLITNKKIPPISSSNFTKNKSTLLTDEQEGIIAACLAGENVFFTGGAGTGKSTLLLAIVEKLVAKNGRHTVFVTATTGLAACAVGGTTVHQFAGISVGGATDSGVIHDQKSVKMASKKPYIARQMRLAKVLIVDEISMMGPDLLEALNSIAQECRGNSLPMGGLQTIFTGDFFQLPPVSKIKFGGASANFKTASSSSTQRISYQATTNAPPNYVHSQQQVKTVFNFFQPKVRDTVETDAVRSSSTSISLPKANITATDTAKTAQFRFCFQSPVWGEIIGKNTYVLTDVFRQSDAGFAALLNSIRSGELTDEIQDTLKACVGRQFDSSDGILPTRIFTHRKDVDDLNTQELASLPDVCIEFRSIDTGDPLFLRCLQSHCPAKAILKLKIGAQVILIKSLDPLNGMVNGSQAVITRFTRDTKRPVIRFSNGAERTIMNEDFSINSGGKMMAQRTQLPLDLAWGISVHKSQGMTVDKAILSLRNVFEYGQAYVALSRVRTLEGLSLEGPLSKDQVKSHSEVVAFYKKIGQNKEPADRKKNSLIGD